MNKIINELLNTNARVIIPDFGAFIIKQKNPRLVVFNEFLRYNDGLLIDYISASDKIEKSTAKAKVNRFVEEINQTLARGDEFKIEGLGTLARDDTGKLTFSEKITASPESQQKAKKSTTTKDVGAKASPDTRPEQKKADEKKQEQKEKAPKEGAAVKKEPTEEKKEQTEEKKSKEEEPVEITFEKEDIKPSGAREEAKSKEKKISVTPIKTAETREEPKKATQTAYAMNKPAEKRTRKRNSKQIVIWVLLIVFVNAAIVAWFLFNDQITGIFKRDKLKQYEMTTDTEAEQESPAVEQVYEPDVATETQTGTDLPQEIEQETETPAVAPATQPVMHDRKEYYIVAGCFREESNADQLVTDLRKKGFQAEKFGKIGNLHAVSFSSFTDKSAALEELKKIRNTEQEGAWIAYY